MVSLVYPDEAVTFVPVENALSTAGSAVGTPASAASPAELPERASLAALADPACGGCLRDVFLELDIRVRRNQGLHVMAACHGAHVCVCVLGVATSLSWQLIATWHGARRPVR